MDRGERQRDREAGGLLPSGSSARSWACGRCGTCGASFSLEPEARSLVVAGPYRLARHPIYTVYILNNTGIWLRTLSLPFLIVLLAWFALLALRVRYEEAVLSAAFPEYEAYRRRVGAFGPRLAKQSS